MQCKHGDCLYAYHPFCGMISGEVALVVTTDEIEDENEDTQYALYCPRHTPKGYKIPLVRGSLGSFDDEKGRGSYELLNKGVNLISDKGIYNGVTIERSSGESKNHQTPVIQHVRRTERPQYGTEIRPGTGSTCVLRDTDDSKPNRPNRPAGYIRSPFVTLGSTDKDLG